jgi:hypothetical protein
MPEQAHPHARIVYATVVSNFLRDLVLYPNFDTLAWALAHNGTEEWGIDDHKKGYELPRVSEDLVREAYEEAQRIMVRSIAAAP